MPHCCVTLTIAQRFRRVTGDPPGIPPEIRQHAYVKLQSSRLPHAVIPRGSRDHWRRVHRGCRVTRIFQHAGRILCTHDESLSHARSDARREDNCRPTRKTPATMCQERLFQLRKKRDNGDGGLPRCFRLVADRIGRGKNVHGGLDQSI